MSDVASAIRERLAAALDPERIDLVDESALHAGHEGARGGGGHFRLTIVSARFEGARTVARHRMVYDALGPLMRREIHALAIKALTPQEASGAQQLASRKETA
jgi:BolA protein